ILKGLVKVKLHQGDDSVLEEFNVSDITILKNFKAKEEVLDEKALKELWRVTKRGGMLLLPTYLCRKESPVLKLYRLLGFRQSSEFTYESYGKMLSKCRLGKVRLKLIKGTIPCCYAVIEKE
ncbi:MAG: hypothetical protein IJZ65_09985, partial [Ruminiclostridium sp.]|nr:hypothetical protein [Ruminiclostridium sp.]